MVSFYAKRTATLLPFLLITVSFFGGCKKEDIAATQMAQPVDVTPADY